MLSAQRHETLAMIQGSGRLAPYQFGNAAIPQRMADAWHMGQSLGKKRRLAHAGHRLLGLAHKPKRKCVQAQAAHRRIVPAIEQRVPAMRVAVIEGKTLAHIFPGNGGLASEDRRRPGGVTWSRSATLNSSSTS